MRMFFVKHQWALTGLSKWHQRYEGQHIKHYKTFSQSLLFFISQLRPQSQGCHAGSMRHRLSRLLAAATRVLTLLSPPSNCARLWRRVMMAVTAFWTSDTSCWESMFSGWPAGDRGMDVSSWVFLCQAIISSRRTAFRMPSTCQRQEIEMSTFYLTFALRKFSERLLTKLQHGLKRLRTERRKFRHFYWMMQFRLALKTTGRQEVHFFLKLGKRGRMWDSGTIGVSIFTDNFSA